MKIRVDAVHTVSAILESPANPIAGLVLAHGSGAGMRHAFMSAVAAGLHARQVATLRYQFPYKEAGGTVQDRPPLAHATVRAAVDAACLALPGLPLFAGGKSYGGRMTSQAQAKRPLPNVAGVVFLGFPLHPIGSPSTDRANHLTRISEPMLFVQGTRDPVADLSILSPVIAGLGGRATLLTAEAADHGFRVAAGSASTDEETLDALLDQAVAWMGRIIAEPDRRERSGAVHRAPMMAAL